jgi:hypothetical protein
MQDQPEIAIDLQGSLGKAIYDANKGQCLI